MKRNILFLYLLIVLLPVTGCSNAIHDDLATYINVSLGEIMHYEQRAIDTYNTMANKDNLSHKDLQTALETTIIPTYKNFLASLQKISPTTEEVDNLHQLYVQASKNQLAGFVLLKEGLETNEPIKITESEALFKKAKKQIETFRDTLSILANEHNIDR